ncbi:bifunctional riboflavin kinase/FAD synthetase [Halarsenatibacter silvermanii]|uniref:Riboflavin biosynthesis protein n=1 Tax=Halarsenatibacter silvermanii TaxID=321763 RepID=A0A1G9LHU0_9FIRM|nr:bifunctional riboflavin kinase/FAD synthetase [Halarsenatibacter silvermanii]SDL61510.1 riboflavin kinase / FMN adenylyltransferase [Halarsenatibacter silvermanii]
MKVYKDDEFSEYQDKATSLALGTFDGLHRGHQKVIKKARNNARCSDLAAGIFSFVPHPRRVLNQEEGPRVICSQRQKKEILQEIGLDYYFCQEFTEEFSRMNFKDFIAGILCDELKSGQLVVGKDFTFGHRGEGTSQDLKKMGRYLDFEVKIVSPLRIKGKKISSTRIRKLISEGRVGKIPPLLGRKFALAGRVVHGSGRGHEIGFPTANLELEADYVRPKKGVYAGYVVHEEKEYRSIANFGRNPTFSEEDFRVEIHILDLKEDRDFYGSRLEFTPVEFIREEQKFDSVEGLKETIKSDILYTKKIL